MLHHKDKIPNLTKIGSLSMKTCCGYIPFYIFPSFYQRIQVQNDCRSIPVFSSPEHNVLRGSYCDRSSSGVRPSVCPSVRPSVRPSVNNFFKNLLQNQKANLDKTWQECSLGEALQKLLKEFNSNKNSGCHGNKMAENGKNL